MNWENRTMMRIGELARLTKESVKTIRYWENQGLLEAQRSESGYRHFDKHMIERVDFIRNAQMLGFTLDEIQEILELRSEGTQPCDHVRDALTHHLETVRRRIRELRNLENDLAKRLAWTIEHPDVDCDNIEGCIYVHTPTESPDRHRPNN
jgi:DNA-binding transcriptional MerR regulator